MRVSRAIVCVTGLLKPHLTNTGLVALSKTLRHHAPRTSVVKLYRWKDYETILSDLKEWNPSSITFIGHSYGVSTSLFACAELQHSTPFTPISHVISTDGVWRECVNRIDASSLESNHTLVVPKNVVELHTFRQRHGLIQGHDFSLTSPTRWVTDVIVNHPKHARMDRLPEFIELAKRLCAA